MDKTITLTLPDGSKVHKHIRAKNEKELELKIEKAYKELTRGKKLSLIIDEWRDYHFKNINLNTQSGYAAPIKDIKEQFGDKYLDEIKPLDIEQFLYTLYDERKYAKQTLKLRLIVLNLVYDYSILKGYCQINPCTPVKAPRNAIKTKRELPQAEAIQIVTESRKEWLLPFFLLYTGCRVGEALALQYEDIDFENNTISINKTIIFDNGIPIIQNHTKTDAGNRSVPLLAPLKELIPRNKNGFIFNDNGAPLKKGQLYFRWRQFKRKYNVDISPHQLRHAYATILYDAGLPVKDSQLLLGHNSAEVTQNIYTHISEERRKQTFSQLQAFTQNLYHEAENP